ncbi:hypothetical protein IAT38_002370 [Cryptococcus sp. DSM 104549]
MFSKKKSATKKAALRSSSPEVHAFHRHGDIILLANDRVMFYADSWKLAQASEFFSGMFSTAQPDHIAPPAPAPAPKRGRNAASAASASSNISQKGDKSEVTGAPIDLDVPSNILDLFLNLANVSVPFIPDTDYDTALQLISFCEKFLVRQDIVDQVLVALTEQGKKCQWKLLINAAERGSRTIAAEALGMMKGETFLLGSAPDYDFRKSMSQLPPAWQADIMASIWLVNLPGMPTAYTKRTYYSMPVDEEYVWCTDKEFESRNLLAVARTKVEEYQRVLEEEAAATEVDIQASIERAKVQKELAPLAEVMTQFDEVRKSILEVKHHLKDPDPTLQEMFEAEHEELCGSLDELIVDAIPPVLLPPLPTANLPVMMSLNAGVGGLESALCTEDLARMYLRFAANRRWKVEEITRVDGTGGKGGGGIREMTVKIEAPSRGGGDDAREVYGALQWESGVHRLQRVPENETLGRIHTSTVAVIVLPIYPDTEDEPLVDPKDVRTDVMRARGAGGQHVNRTESAVRLVHVPTGITVSMQDSRSQHQNKAWAWDILRARLSEKKHNEEVERRRAGRRDKVKGADFSDKIRTYNFNQDRLTDHRYGISVNGLQNILDGEGLEHVLAMIKKDFRERRIESLLEGDEDLDL